MGFSEMLLLSLLGFLLFGPKKSAELAREIGQHVANFKRAAGDLQAQLVNELPTQAIGSEVDHLRQTIIGTLPSNLTVESGIDLLANFAKATPEAEAASETPQLEAEALHPQLSDAHRLISETIQ